jgi:cobalt-zinc-cadmium efflux system outer membrane protein
LNYDQAKGIFLKENLQLIAAHFSIDSAEAELMTAKLWSNPHITWNSDFYNVHKNQYLNYNLQKFILLEQTFSASHSALVKLAKSGVELSKAGFEDFMRGAVLQFNSDYSQLTAMEQKARLYQAVVAQYDTLIQAMRSQVKVGGLSPNELIRIESEYFSIQSDATNNQSSMESTMAEFRTFLNILPDVFVETIPFRELKVPAFPSVEALYDSSKLYRPDYRVSVLSIDNARRNLALQRALVIPTFKLGFVVYDQGSNYNRPSSSINLDFDLPFFDRNQGNIKGAQVSVRTAELQAAYQAKSMLNEVSTDYHQFRNYQERLNNYSPDFLDRLEQLNRYSLQNYSRRMISLLEFIDQQRIYIDTQTQYLDMQNNFFQAVHRLNYSIGKEIIPVIN